MFVTFKLHPLFSLLANSTWLDLKTRIIITIIIKKIIGKNKVPNEIMMISSTLMSVKNMKWLVRTDVEANWKFQRKYEKKKQAKKDWYVKHRKILNKAFVDRRMVCTSTVYKLEGQTLGDNACMPSLTLSGYKRIL